MGIGSNTKLQIQFVQANKEHDQHTSQYLNKNMSQLFRGLMLHNVVMLSDNTFPTYAMKECEINKKMPIGM
jgi:hypothetical protein